jgi:LAS superfamily LD-carboxypeptidase LdcB
VVADVQPDAERMRGAAAAVGVTLVVNSAWRTNEQQAAEREKYLAGKGPVAAPVGWSRHEEGRALDIESAGGTNASYVWLLENAARFGFKATVPSEPWHWEHP